MIRNHKAKKDKQDHVKKKKLKRSQNDRQRNGKKTKDWETGTTLKTCDEPRYSGRESNSCSTRGTRCDIVKRHEHRQTWTAC